MILFTIFVHLFLLYLHQVYDFAMASESDDINYMLNCNDIEKHTIIQIKDLVNLQATLGSISHRTDITSNPIIELTLEYLWMDMISFNMRIQFPMHHFQSN